MTRDQLDDLLDRSAPATREAAEDDLRAMVRSARRLGVPSWLRRVAIGGGLVVVLAGVSGAAFAGDVLESLPRTQEPEISHTVLLSSVPECETQAVVIEAGPLAGGEATAGDIGLRRETTVVSLWQCASEEK